jgi:methionine aminopeptidase
MTPSQRLAQAAEAVRAGAPLDDAREEIGNWLEAEAKTAEVRTAIWDACGHDIEEAAAHSFRYSLGIATALRMGAAS